MAELAFESARSLARKLRRRELSSRELLEYFIARIERLNPALNAVITTDFDGARVAADAADAELARGELRGPLHGVPMTIKDAFEIRGMRTTAGAKPWRDHVATKDAVAVQRLRAAGAIFMGHTNVPAFCADLQTFNEIFGTSNNPWNLERTPGGSSGGAAAALAAGLTPIELGSDIGGSIRTPSSFCGVFGHKPSFGIVPLRGHMPGPPGALSAGDLSVAGPLARDAEDLALLLGVLAGPGPEDAIGYSLRLPQPRNASLRGYRLAYWFDDPACPVSQGVRTRLEHCADALRGAGAQLVAAKPDLELAELYRLYRALLEPAMSLGLPEKTVEALRGLAASTLTDHPYYPFAVNILRPHREWRELDETRQQLRAKFKAFFEDYDALLCPVTFAPAILHDQSEPQLSRQVNIDGQTRPYNDLFVWISLATACYLPASVIPVGPTDGLPVGMQIIGPYLEDNTCLDLAGRISEVTGGFAPPPGY